MTRKALVWLCMSCMVLFATGCANEIQTLSTTDKVWLYVHKAELFSDFSGESLYFCSHEKKKSQCKKVPIE